MNCSVGLADFEYVVGRGGLEPPTSALFRPERRASKCERLSERVGCYRAWRRRRSPKR